MPILSSPLSGPGPLCFNSVRTIQFNERPYHLPRKTCYYVGVHMNKDFRVIKVVDDDDDNAADESNLDWKGEFLGEIDPNPLNKKKQKERSELLQETDSTDWCVRARKSALRSIQTRGLTSAMEQLVKRKTKKKKKKSVLNKKNSATKYLDFESDAEEVELNIENFMDDVDELKARMSNLAGRMFLEKKEKTREAFVEKLSQFSVSGATDRMKEVNLNREIVEAQTAEEVLEVTAEMIMAVGV